MAGVLKSALIIFSMSIGVICTNGENRQDGNKNINRSNISDWVVDYEQIDVTVCRPRSNIPITLTFAVGDLDVIIDFVRHSPVATHVHVNVVQNQHTEPLILNSTAEQDIDVYSGMVRRPCCGNKAVMKLTTAGLDVFLHTQNDTYILEPAMRWNTDRRLKKARKISKQCELYSCIFYKGSDVNAASTLSTAAYALPSNKYNYRPTSSKDTSQKRNKRSFTRTECSLAIMADHTFYEKVGRSSIANTISEMMYIISEADLIFRGTDFLGDGQGDNIGFHVTNIKVFTDPVGYNMANKTDVREYLESFSEYNFNDFCLATAFSSKDFDDGVIGLAWVASPSTYGSIGGICQAAVYYYGKIMSYNTALITTHNAGKMFTKYQSALTLTHEFGHNFGSPHDEPGDETCAPAGEYGNYIMYPSASHELKPNTDIFSPCSVSYMFPVIRNKGYCLYETKEPVCGNGIVEKNEECDCGRSETCVDLDPCCTPSDVSKTNSDLPCTVRRSAGKECSFKTSSCCTDSCRIVATSEQKICRYERGCSNQAYCDGISAHCPDETFQPDKSLCDNGRKTCFNGRCTGSICATADTFSCICSGKDQCYQCCSSSGTGCTSTWSNEFAKITKPAGTSCENGHGFCDEYGVCVKDDHESSLDRMNEAFTESGIKSVRDWFAAYWYYVVGGVAVLAFLTAVFISTCRGDKKIRAGAYLHGQFMRVAMEAAIQKHYLERRKEETTDFYKKKIAALDDESSKMHFTKALARLMTFFPNVPPDVLTRTLKTSASEETAVKWLLLRNYPFRRVSQPIEKEA